MKVMKWNVQYEGNYGGSVDEIVLLPQHINGMLFEEYEEGIYKDEISLGEIEGKHSDVSGDLEVEFLELDKLSIKDAADLIGESDTSYFEGLFDRITAEYEEDEDYDEEKVTKLLSHYDIEEFTWRTFDQIHDKFISKLKEKYVHEFKSITVLERNYDRAVDLLEGAEIQTFD
ncbi:hypothetical protein [Oceanobacillus oncorhynchi]|uniref:hypothetical protein n=1 Tax=Oceanobacillus oncorhynchi TaxID=545501 RepID=UPI0034D4F538